MNQLVLSLNSKVKLHEKAIAFAIHHLVESVKENVQIATEGQYTLEFGIYPNPTDIKTLIPFLTKLKSNNFIYLSIL